MQNEMKTIAMIKDGKVVNLALWDGITSWNPGDEYLLIDVTSGMPRIGDLYNHDTGSFTTLPGEN